FLSDGDLQAIGLTLRLAVAGAPCGLCGAGLVFYEHSHGKDWLLCPDCGLVAHLPPAGEAAVLDQGEAGGAKLPPDSLVHRRERFFCDLFLEAMGWTDVLLYGVGWSLVFEQLRARGVHAVGCDLWRPLIRQRREAFGPDSFFHRDELPEVSFDLISAFEVFEHFASPLRDVRVLTSRLRPESAIVGCTDFRVGGPLSQHPGHSPDYWRHRTHLCAWNYSSMNRLARLTGLTASYFKVFLGSLGAKVFFVLHRGPKTAAYVQSLPKLFRKAF
ncbi:methyltransferase domain-containing protein, partial [Desulfolutivibrio sp.]|uniref:methyltransferase domain-containing protein n=1 Tax=Desulfolutivibrio sp. TaxID=2773296 RepID=UPI002F96ABB6